MKKRLLLIALFIGAPLTALMTYKLVDTGTVQINRPSPESYPVRGIDVSHHNGALDWKRIAQGGMGFAYIKATEGGDFIDPKFNENWQKAQAAGVSVGAYHFFTFCRPGIEQLDNFIDTVPIETGTLPPAIDFEFGGNCKARPARTQIHQELTLLMDGLEQAYGQKPVLYVTNEAYKDYIKGSFPNTHIWIRDIFRAPRLNQNWTFWQYSARGHVAGAPGITDLNVFYGSKEEFEKLLSK